MFPCSTQNSEDQPQLSAGAEDNKAEDSKEEEEEESPVKLSTLPGAKTSDFYSVKDIPERFNHPGMQLSTTALVCYS